MDKVENTLQVNQFPDPRLTREGCSVLLDINDGDRLVFARLSAGAKLKIGKDQYSLHPLVGCPFGSLFQVENGAEGPSLSRVLPTSEQGDKALENGGNASSKDESRDNRAIVDDNRAQNLTNEEIEDMKRQGATANEIVEALIANSSTFEKKTAFSQEKYRLRKQKKYAPRVLLRRPLTRSICEAYFKKYPARIGFMRMDMLSLLLSMANVTANSNVLILDMIGGLLTGAVAERLGGHGDVCSVYHGEKPYPMDIVRMFNFSNEVLRRIVRSSIDDLCKPCEQNNQLEESPNAEKESNVLSSSICMEESTVSPEDKIAEAAELMTPAGKAPQAGAKASKEAIQSWRETGFSCLVIAAPEQDPWYLIRDLLPLLSYSAPFAVYHQYLQPLATCMHNLQLEKMAIGLHISEPWLREYQVLPSRTHPCMQMNATGGYVLSGTRIYGT